MLMNNPQYLSQLQAMYPNSVPVAPYQATGTSLDLWGMSNYGTLNNAAGATQDARPTKRHVGFNAANSF